VVGGFTEGKGSRKHLGALLLGAYRNGRLHYFGHSGSGFSEKGLKDALDRMKPLFTDKSPFENPPRIPERIQWVKPKLVCRMEPGWRVAPDRISRVAGRQEAEGRYLRAAVKKSGCTVLITSFTARAMDLFEFDDNDRRYVFAVLVGRASTGFGRPT